MSIYTKQTAIASFPAYVVFEREADHTGRVNITASDILGLNSGRGFYRTYSPGSVASYALQYNECPYEAAVRATKKGQRLHWINQRATVITDSPRGQEQIVNVRPGMRVRFEGLDATIEMDHNNNIKFSPIDSAA